jgi:hypothetical protein
MQNKRWPGLLLAVLWFSAPSVGSAAPFFDFYGYSFADGDPLAVGATSTIPMRLNPVQPEPALSFDFSQYEVTVVVRGLEVVSVEDHGSVRTLHYDHGVIDVYQDLRKDSQWSASPPNGQVPGLFENGELILAGYFTDCVMVYNRTGKFGTVQGHVTFNGGRRLGELPQLAGWLFFGGATGSPQGGLPAGYSLAWDPQLLSQPPVPARRSTWGTIRAIYR